MYISRYLDISLSLSLSLYIYIYIFVYLSYSGETTCLTLLVSPTLSSKVVHNVANYDDP